MMKRLGEELKGLGFNLQPYYGGTLFKQGTELVALQRGNLQMGNIAPQDISNQIPEWSVLTSAYLFRDAAHVTAFFDSETGAGNTATQLGISPEFLGAVTGKASTSINPDLGRAIDQSILAEGQVEDLSLLLGAGGPLPGIRATAAHLLFESAELIQDAVLAIVFALGLT